MAEWQRQQFRTAKLFLFAYSIQMIEEDLTKKIKNSWELLDKSKKADVPKDEWESSESNLKVLTEFRSTSFLVNPTILPKEFCEKNLSGSYSYNEMQNERKVYKVSFMLTK